MTDTSRIVMYNGIKVAVIVPCYCVRAHIGEVIAAIGPEVWRIYIVDDKCPEQSGQYVLETVSDRRVVVVFNLENRGVGGAMMQGYKKALEDGADIMVKIDGDGQMDPALISSFVDPIWLGHADYTKGNRFYDLEKIFRMPKIRIFGNAALSFITKLSTGYWDLFDPTNGYTALHRDVAVLLPMNRISQRYFFETDMLFRLGTVRAKVIDIPMEPIYGDEVSHLKISRVFSEFLLKHTRNFFKRIFYNYFLRGMSIASFELLFGLPVFVFGVGFGVYHWILSSTHNVPTPTGTVMISALSILMGFQLLLAFLNSDFSSMPNHALHATRRKPVARTE